MSDAPIRLERDGAVAVLTLAQPQSRNALSLDMLEALERAIAEVDADPAAKVLVIAAEGQDASRRHLERARQRHVCCLFLGPFAVRHEGAKGQVRARS